MQYLNPARLLGHSLTSCFPSVDRPGRFQGRVGWRATVASFLSYCPAPWFGLPFPASALAGAEAYSRSRFLSRPSSLLCAGPSLVSTCSRMAWRPVRPGAICYSVCSVRVALSLIIYEYSKRRKR